MIIPKFYCKECGKFKHRWEVKHNNDIRFYNVYECKWCHNTVYHSLDVLEEGLSVLKNEGKI